MCDSEKKELGDLGYSLVGAMVDGMDDKERQQFVRGELERIAGYDPEAAVEWAVELVQRIVQAHMLHIKEEK